MVGAKVTVVGDGGRVVDEEGGGVVDKDGVVDVGGIVDVSYGRVLGVLKEARTPPTTPPTIPPMTIMATTIVRIIHLFWRYHGTEYDESWPSLAGRAPGSTLSCPPTAVAAASVLSGISLSPFSNRLAPYLSWKGAIHGGLIEDTH